MADVEVAGVSRGDLLAKLRAGADPAELAALVLPSDIQTTLKHIAPLRWVDAPLWDEELRPRAPQAAPLEPLRDRGLLEELPLEPGRLFLADETRTIFLKQWAPDDLRRFSAELASVFRARDDVREALYHLLLADVDEAVALFETHFKVADAAFDLRTAQDLLDLFERPDRRALVDTSLRGRLARWRAYVTTRSSWSADYYRSAGFLERPRYTALLRSVVQDGQPRALQLVARGGMGKTMLLRWLAARYCIPRGFLVARIDFDEIDSAIATQYPWLVLLELARQLNEQMPTRPFEELLDERRRLLPALVRAAGRDTSAAVSELADVGKDEDLAVNVVRRYGSAMASRGSDNPIVIILDTLETPFLRVDLRLDPLVDLLGEVYERSDGTRLVLSGRYDLRDRTDLRGALDRLAVETVHLEEFSLDEGRAYLTDVRGIGNHDLVEAILSKDDLLPFTLALYGDIVRHDPDIEPAAIEAFESPKLLYLIDRVLERIEDRDIRFLLRYGVVPRQLGKRFVADVMMPYLAGALAKAPIGDEPARDPHERMAAAFRVDKAAAPPDVDDLWERLTRYAASESWVSRVEGMGDYVSFHPDVREPMRLVLEEQDVLRRLHREAVDHFRQLCAEEPERWTRWAEEVAYHYFQADGPGAVDGWTALLAEAERVDGPARRAELAAAVTADMDLTVDGGRRPGPWFGRRKIMTMAVLASAHLEVALARLQDRSMDVHAWDEVLQRFAIVQTMERSARKRLVDRGRRDAVALAVAVHSGKPAVLADLQQRLDATDDPEVLEVLVRLGLSTPDPLGVKELQRLDARLSGRAATGSSALLVDVRSELTARLLASGDVAGAGKQLGRLAQWFSDDLAKLRAQVCWARGAPTEAARILDAESIDPDTVGFEGEAWLAAGLPDRALGALRRLNTSGLSPNEATIQVGATVASVQFRLDGQVAGALDDVSGGVQLVEQAALRCREAGDLVREAQAWAVAATMLLEHGRIHDAEDRLQYAELAIVPTGHDLAITTRLLRARFLGRRDRTEEAEAILRPLLYELRMRQAGPAVRARTAVEGLALEAPAEPHRYLAELDDAVSEFRPSDAALIPLDGLPRCATLPDTLVGRTSVLFLRRLLRRADASDLDDPHDEANRLVRLAEVARFIGDRELAMALLERVASLELDTGSLIPLRVLQAASRVGIGWADADPMLERMLSRPGIQPALALDALVAWAHCVDGFGWLDRIGQIVDLVERAGTPTQRNADALGLRIAAVRAGKLDNDLGSLLDLARQVYEELGDLTAAGRLAASPDEASLGGPPVEDVPSFVTLVPDEAEAAEAGLVAPTWHAGGSTELTGRIVDETESVVEDLRRVLGDASAGKADACLRAGTPKLAELPWELAWRVPTSGPSGVLFSGERDEASRQWVRRLQNALLQAGYRSFPDGILGPQTRESLRHHQERVGLTQSGLLNRATERSLWLEARREPLVLLVRRSHEIRLRKARSSVGPDDDRERIYRRYGAVAVVDDPTQEDLERVQARPTLVHIQASFESLGGAAGISFSSGANLRESSDFGSEVLGTTAVDMLLARVRVGFGPFVVLETLTPSSPWEAARQLFLRNLFASQLYELGNAAAILAVGPIAPGQGLDPGEVIARAFAGEDADVRHAADLWRLLRRDADYQNMPRIGSLATTALFAADPYALTTPPGS